MDELSYSSVNNIDVLIIGSGPIGLTATLWFIKNGYKVILTEQHGEVKSSNRRAFNERHQQVGLDADTVKFLKDLDIIIWGEIKRKGCVDADWINIPIYILQNILIKEIRTYKNAKILFDTKIESVNCFDPKSNCRIFLINDTIPTSTIYGLSPRLVVIADGRHDDKGAAKQFFNFSSACRVHLSTYGIVGMLERNVSDESGSICLKNFSSDSYLSESHSELGHMYIRLLGNMKERYVALGLGDAQDAENFLALNSNQIRFLLVEAYNQKRDRAMGEPEIGNNDFSECSRTPIPIILDYRKETIKLLEGSSTIVSIEGDAARKTTFFSGSGLNSGYKALLKLFNFCRENGSLIFDNLGDPNSLLTIDQKLLEKDQDCMHISLQLLIKGLNYIRSKEHSSESASLIDDEPIIHSISPTEGEVPWFIHINGSNLIGVGGKPPTCIFEWDNGIFTTNDIIVYDNNTIGVRIPRTAENKVSILLKRFDSKTAISPVQFSVIKLLDPPEIINIHKQDEWLCIEGQNFKVPSYVTLKDAQSETRIKAYCNSVSSLVFAPDHQLSGKISFIVETNNGSSQEFTKDFDAII